MTKRGANTYGRRPPANRIKIQIYQYEGTEQVKSVALTVYGLSFAHAENVIRQAIAKAIGN